MSTSTQGWLPQALSECRVQSFLELQEVSDNCPQNRAAFSIFPLINIGGRKSAGYRVYRLHFLLWHSSSGTMFTLLGLRLPQLQTEQWFPNFFQQPVFFKQAFPPNLNICDSSVLCNSQKVETTQVSKIDEWLNKMWCIHTTGYSDFRKEILTQATTWMSLEDIMLSEISQPQTDKHCMISLI